jgi:DNA primase
VSRGISLGTAVSLGIGFATGAGLREHLERAGFPAQAIAESGLFTGDHERFEGRIVVPHVASGHVTWLVGRAIEPSMEPRFQALPGPKPVLGAGHLRPPHAVVLTEGLFDWLTLVQWGLPACATLGGHSLERVLTALSSCRRVYLALDADDAGREATERLAALLGARAVPLSLPAGIKDVADLATLPDGRRTFLRLIERARRGHCQ